MAKSRSTCYDLFKMNTLEPNLLPLRLHTVEVASPFLAASGTFGWGSEFAEMMPKPGAIIMPTLTLEPRNGNPMPRTVEATAGLLHATGLPNPGLAQFLNNTLPALRNVGCPLVVSIYGETPVAWQRLAQGLNTAAGIAALELNLLPSEMILGDSAQTRYDTSTLQQNALDTIALVREIWSGTLIAKLPPFGLGVGAFARQAELCGADVLALNQGFPGYAVKGSSGAARLANGAGILSGPCIKPLALYQVYEAAQSVSCPIIGGGGIMTLEDAREFFAVGAAAVSVGIATLVHPSAIAKLTQEWQASLSNVMA